MAHNGTVSAPLCGRSYHIERLVWDPPARSSSGNPGKSKLQGLTRVSTPFSNRGRCVNPLCGRHFRTGRDAWKRLAAPLCGRSYHIERLVWDPLARSSSGNPRKAIALCELNALCETRQRVRLAVWLILRTFMCIRTPRCWTGRRLRRIWRRGRRRWGW
jgi:hypothetical protein